MTKSVVFKSSILLLIIYFIPLLVILWFINAFSVNVPFWDQWSLVDLFEKIFTGRVNFDDFFIQHNEHRIFFPKILFVVLALISKWNIRYEMYFNVFLVAVTFLSLYKLSSLTAEKEHSIAKHWTNILTCILLFSIIQYENWLWGFQIPWFLINACLAVAILLIALSNNSPKRLYFAAVPCFIASFSAAHGLLTWLAVVPLVASVKGSYRERMIRITVWILLFIGTFTIYFTGYQKPSHHPDTLLSLKHPLSTGYYFFTLLGTPLVYKAIIPTALGAILFLTFLLLVFQFLKKSKRKLNLDLEVASWISIGLFAILFALITTVARTGFGVGHSMSSRYTTCSILLIISVAHLWRLSVSRNSFILGILIGLIFMNSINQIPQARSFRLQRLAGETCLEILNFINGSEHSCLEIGLLPLPHTNQLKKLAGILEEIGFRKFPKDISFITEPVKSHGNLDSPPTEGTLVTISRSGTINITGWASLPDSEELPKTVLFSYGSSKSFFADALVNPDVPILAKAPHSIQFNKVGWSANISPKSLPLGETLIKAWVYNPTGKQVVRLNGELKVNVISE